MIRCRKPCRPGTDDSYLFVFFSIGILFSNSRLYLAICQKTLQGTDGNRLINVPALTPGFTGMVTHSAADSGQRIPLPFQTESFFKFTGSNQGNITNGVDVHGAGMLTGSMNQSLTGSGRTPLLLNMCLILIPEILYRTQHRIRTGAPQLAE